MPNSHDVSYHILHIFTHGSSLSKERGRVTCKTRETRAARSLPIEDLRAVIIAARGVALSSNLISSLAANDTIILHCDDHYQPVAWTVPHPRTTRAEVLRHQINLSPARQARLWNQIIRAKVRNQATLLREINNDSNAMEHFLNTTRPNEASAARIYWKLLFRHLNVLPAFAKDESSVSRAQRSVGRPNQCLNYGYAVLSALIHRAVIVFGLLPQLGIHHRYRYRSVPLVYDLMESYRPFVDRFLGQWACADQSIEQWPRAVADGLREEKVDTPWGGPVRLLDAIDLTCRQFATCVAASGSRTELFLPALKPKAA